MRSGMLWKHALPAEMVDTEAPNAGGRVIRQELGLLGCSCLHQPPCEALLLLRVSCRLACGLVEAEDPVQLNLCSRV